MKEIKLAATRTRGVLQALPGASTGEVSDLLVTGGDPMVMKSQATCANYLEPLLAPGVRPRFRTIRIGTKSLTFWPQRFVSDADADEVLRLFESHRAAGRQARSP